MADINSTIDQCVRMKRISYPKYVSDDENTQIIRDCASEKINECFDRELKTIDEKPPSRYGSDDLRDVSLKYNQVLQKCFSTTHFTSLEDDYVLSKQKLLAKKAFVFALDDGHELHPQVDGGLVSQHQGLRKLYETTTTHAHGDTDFQWLDHKILMWTLIATSPITSPILAIMTGTVLPIAIMTFFDAPIKTSIAVAEFILLDMEILTTPLIIAGAFAMAGYVTYKGESEWNKIEDLKHQALWYIENCMPPRTETSLKLKTDGKYSVELVPETEEIPIIKHPEHADYLPAGTTCENWAGQ